MKPYKSAPEPTPLSKLSGIKPQSSWSKIQQIQNRLQQFPFNQHHDQVIGEIIPGINNP